jgi:multicomponent Na+:H+ antiporter subunit G
MTLGCDILAVLFLALGAFVGLTGAVGILRMPDFYSRLHPSGKNDTLAQTCIMIGLLFHMGGAWIAKSPHYYGVAGVIPRLVMITLFVFLTSPIATHAVTRAAHLSGLKIWEKEGDRHV